MRTIVLDLETKKLFEEVEKGDRKALGVSCVGIWDSQLRSFSAKGVTKSKQDSGGQAYNDGFRAFMEDELYELWPILNSADLIVGFNINGFDMPVLSPYYIGKIENLPTLDLLDMVKEALGFRLKLDHLARATLGYGKNGNGLDACRFYKEGKLEELKKYCLNDVAVTRDLYLFAKEKGILKYPDLGDTVKEFKVEIDKFMPQKADLIQVGLGF